MIERLDHVGIAVRSIEDRMPFYRYVLGLEHLGTETVSEQKVRLALLRAGDVNIELLEPRTADSPIARFIEKRGEGIHHLSFQVDDIVAAITTLRTANMRMIDEEPRSGADGRRIAFVHPDSSGRVLIELTEREDS